MCFVLRDEVDEFDNRHSGFWRSLTSTVALNCQKMFATMRKTEKIKPDLNFFMTDKNVGGSV